MNGVERPSEDIQMRNGGLQEANSFEFQYKNNLVHQPSQGQKTSKLAKSTF